MLEGPNESDIHRRARALAHAGGIRAALATGAVPKLVETTLSEALVLGLLKQGVRKYFAIFGHGSTDLGNVLRIYEEEGVTRTLNCRNEVEMAHAATALRWQYGDLCAVVTSIGPGAMQAFAGSLAAASNGVGVYHIYIVGSMSPGLMRRLAASALRGVMPKLYDGTHPKGSRLWSPSVKRYGGRDRKVCPPYPQSELGNPYFAGGAAPAPVLPGVSLGGTPMTFTPAPRATSIASIMSAYFTPGTPFTKMIFSGRGS